MYAGGAAGDRKEGFTCRKRGGQEEGGALGQLEASRRRGGEGFAAEERAAARINVQGGYGTGILAAVMCHETTQGSLWPVLQVPANLPFLEQSPKAKASNKHYINSILAR